MITNLHKEIESAGGLFFLCNLKMKERRASLPSSKWCPPIPKSITRGTGRVYFTKPEELPVKHLQNFATVDNVSDEPEVEVSAADPTELSLEEKPIEAGADDPDPDGQDEPEAAQDGEFAHE